MNLWVFTNNISVNYPRIRERAIDPPIYYSHTIDRRYEADLPDSMRVIDFDASPYLKTASGLWYSYVDYESILGDRDVEFHFTCRSDVLEGHIKFDGQPEEYPIEEGDCEEDHAEYFVTLPTPELGTQRFLFRTTKIRHYDAQTRVFNELGDQRLEYLRSFRLKH